jgi:hypothetical protein
MPESGVAVTVGLARVSPQRATEMIAKKMKALLGP